MISLKVIEMWSFIKGKKLFIIAFCIAFFLSNSVVAQDNPDLPCDGLDPYAECPLDSWNYVLIATGMILGTYVLYKKHRGQADV